MATNWLTWLRGRTWLQFSLRGFFVVITIACIGLAVVERQARSRHRAIAAIEKLGGSITFEHERDASGRKVPNAVSTAPDFLRGTVGEEYFRRVRSVSITAPWHGHSPVTDDNLTDLRHLNELKYLDLSQAEFTGAGLRHLSDNLESLSLSYAWYLRDEGLVHLKGMTQLHDLRLNNTAITDKGLAHLSQLNTLTSLSLSDTDITDMGLKHLEPLTNLTSVSLRSTNVTRQGVDRLQQALPKCQLFLSAALSPPKVVELWPDDYRPTREEVMAKAKELNGLIYLADTHPDRMYYCLSLTGPVPTNTVARLLKELPDVAHVVVQGNADGDGLVQELSRWPNLRHIGLHDCNVTDASLKYLRQLPKLGELDLHYNRITDAAVHDLAATKWHIVYLKENRMTQKGLDELKKLTTRHNIHIR